ncbi:MAG: hypothetical protein MI749_11580, partial [Desulfovibrionales bacterium]|nr:hypothetical protein [Desulfovibrionales bacterium]
MFKIPQKFMKIALRLGIILSLGGVPAFSYGFSLIDYFLDLLLPCPFRKIPCTPKITRAWIKDLHLIDTGPNDFRFIQILGTGAHGSVYAVEYGGQEYAMKMLPYPAPLLHYDSSYIQFFLNDEARVLMEAGKHPNIVQTKAVYFSDKDTVQAIVMERAESSLEKK